MNAVEHIVECYFRYCIGCFTMTDVKVHEGNNRQCDLLAYNVATREPYHVESSVTHTTGWLSSILKQLNADFDKKFRGVPPKREGEKTDFSKGKTYFDNILQTYRNVGFDPKTIRRVFVTWVITDQKATDQFLHEYHSQHKIKVEVLSFRDTIVPGLLEKISTSNYEDEVLRTLSLLRQRELQQAQ